MKYTKVFEVLSGHIAGLYLDTYPPFSCHQELHLGFLPTASHDQVLRK